MASKRKYSSNSADQLPVDPSEELLFLCLGGGNEVGRSCHILQYKGKTVMLDAGMHPAYEGLAALPFFDEFDLSTVDVLLISQYVHPSRSPFSLVALVGKRILGLCCFLSESLMPCLNRTRHSIVGCQTSCSPCRGDDLNVYRHNETSAHSPSLLACVPVKSLLCCSIALLCPPFLAAHGHCEANLDAASTSTTPPRSPTCSPRPTSRGASS